MFATDLPSAHSPDSSAERLQAALLAADVGTWDLDIVNQRVWWDTRCKELYGFDRDDVVPYAQVLSYMHPDDRLRVDEAVQWAQNPRSEGRYDIQFRTVGATSGQLRWLHCRGGALFDEQGVAYRFSGIAQEITQLVDARHQLNARERRFINLIDETPTATAIYLGRDMVIQAINRPMLQLWGRDASIINQTLHQAMPEFIGQPFLVQLQHVYDTGEACYIGEGRADIVMDGQLREAWFSYDYKPLRDADGHIYGIIHTATSITEQVQTRQQLTISEVRFRSLVEQAPVAMAIFRGPDHVIETANQAHLELWGRQAGQVIGKPLFDALPEVKGHGYEDLLTTVLTTGKPFYANELSAPLWRRGQLETVYFNFVYQPLREADGTITAVMVVANEITEQVQARQRLVASEARFRSLIKESPVAMLVYEGPDMVVAEANEQMLTIFGRGEDVLGKPLLESIPELASTALPEQYRQVLATGQTHYQYSERIPLVKDNQPVWGYYDYVYKALYDTDGTAYGAICTAVDVSTQVVARQIIEESETRYRHLSEQLDELVQQRTHQLAAANQELTAGIDEYAAINEELEEANTLLSRSNDNLQTFAYVASHDLQEPLRKIQQFGDLLKTRLTDLVSAEEMNYLERMQVAASRMSTLIRDLLNFSRISTQRNVDEPVQLNDVLTTVLGVLDLAITETNAQVQVDTLPALSGDAVQLGQLFQNLLSNAIKFRRADVPPQIRVSSQLVALDALPASIKPTRRMPVYARIEVADNGIGFDEKYLDRIFQVFQRLHGKSHYVGTGVGLAICEKVVTNHGGIITASSQPDQGTTFVIYLPTS